MPTIRLTQLSVTRITAPKSGRIVCWDRTLPGFGLRVTAQSSKTWVATYRLANGQKVFETLGSLAKIPNVADARQAARDSMAKAAAGEDPVTEKRVAAERAAASTVNIAVNRWLAHCDRNLKPKTAREWRRIFEHDVLPRWGSRPLTGVTKGDVLELLDDKANARERKRKSLTDGAGVQANKTLTRLRTFWGWAIAQGLVEHDPTAGVRKPVREIARDRVLDDDEIRAFWQATGETDWPFGPMFRLMLVTAQREGEVSGIRWSEIDLNKRQWEIPSSRTKNGKPHIVHLSPLAIGIVEGVPCVGDLLFTGRGDNVVSGFSKAKARLDRAMLAIGGAGIPAWTLHDLRRTAATRMAMSAVRAEVVDRVLNHQAGTVHGVAAIYNRFSYEPERRAALETLSQHVEALLSPKVVPLVRVRADVS